MHYVLKDEQVRFTPVGNKVVGDIACTHCGGYGYQDLSHFSDSNPASKCESCAGTGIGDRKVKRLECFIRTFCETFLKMRDYIRYHLDYEMLEDESCLDLIHELDHIVHRLLSDLKHVGENNG